jgi:P-type Ca2+ transporter type 2C
MKRYNKLVNNLLEELHSDIDFGLSNKQVTMNRIKYGENKISVSKKSILKKLIILLKQPWNLVLFASVLVFFLINILQYYNYGGAIFIESILIAAAFTLSIGISIWLESSYERSFQVFNNMNSDIKVKVVRNGKIFIVPASELVVGDLVKVKAGENAAADGVIIKSFQLKIDKTIVSEPGFPVDEVFGYLYKRDDKIITEIKPDIYCGNLIVSGQGMMLVTAVGSRTKIAQMLNMLMTSARFTTPQKEGLKAVGKSVSVAGLLTAVIIFIGRVFKRIACDEAVLEIIYGDITTDLLLAAA